MFLEKEETLQGEKEVCCPVFDPSVWDNKHHVWDRKLFIRRSIPEIFHIPLPGAYRKAITDMWEKAKAAGAAPELNDFLLIAHDPSPLKADLYMAVTGQVPGEDAVEITGTFFSKVFEASYGDIKKVLKETNQFLEANHMIAKKPYINFPYCPNCARKYGHHYVVVIAEVERI